VATDKSGETWETGFAEALERDDLPVAIAVLEGRNKATGTPGGDDKVKAMAAVQRLAASPQEACRWATRLLGSESDAARSVGAMLAETFIGPLYDRQPRQAEDLMLRVADDPHWEIRESADSLLRQVCKADFEAGYALLQRWATHPSENVRRAVVLTVKKLGKERQPAWGNPLLDLLEPLLGDRSTYVRKNLGPFAIGDGLLRYHPELAVQRLSQWAEAEDEQVRWNVAMAFSTAEGARHLDAALPILERLAADERRFVWRAVASAMRNLGRRAPERVRPVLRAWRQDERRTRPAETALQHLPEEI
jgi:3-methyladenine DNA glycosylase AlkC